MFGMEVVAERVGDDLVLDDPTCRAAAGRQPSALRRVSSTLDMDPSWERQPVDAVAAGGVRSGTVRSQTGVSGDALR